VRAYQSVRDIPDPIDLAVVAVPGLTARAVPAALTHYSLTGLYDDVIGAPKRRETIYRLRPVASRAGTITEF